MTARPPLAVAPASIGRRVGASAIDLAVAAGIGTAAACVTLGIALGLGAAREPSTLVLAFGLATAGAWAGTLAWGLVCTAMQAGTGSVGQRALGLRVVDAAASAPVPAAAATRAPQPAAPRAPAAAAATAAAASIPAPVSPAPAPAAVSGAGAPAHGSVAVAEASAPVIAPLPHAPATRPVTLPSVDRLRATVPSPAPGAALLDAPVVAVLTWDDGTRMAVYGRTLYGRNPSVEDGTATVPVRDETLSLSKTHFEVGGDASGAWACDRHSTNGTVLVRDGGRYPLVPAVPMALRSGDRLELGDRSLTVSVGR